MFKYNYLFDEEDVVYNSEKNHYTDGYIAVQKLLFK